MRRRMLGLGALGLIAICLHGSFVRAQTVEQESEKAAVDRAYRMGKRSVVATSPL